MIRTSKTFRALGTVNTITAYGPGAAAALEEAESRVNDMNDRLSVFREGSEIWRLNENAGKDFTGLKGDTIGLLCSAKKYSQLTDGAFSATSRPLTALWNIKPDGRGSIPGARDIKRAMKLVCDDDLIIDEAAGAAMLRRKGQSVDLGGIAKGYAADEVRRILKAHGVKDAMINLGGTVSLIGKPEVIGVQHPRKSTGIPMGRLTVENSAVVTSGDYERYFESDGVRYHHIIDTKTGFPADTGLCGVTVIGSCAEELDAVSTAMFVLGAEKAAELSKKLGIAAIMIDRSMNVYCSDSLKNNFEIIRQKG